MVVDHLKILVNKAYSSLTCPKKFCVPNEALTKSIKKRSRLILSLSTVAEIYFDPKQSLRITQFALSEDWYVVTLNILAWNSIVQMMMKFMTRKIAHFLNLMSFFFEKSTYPLTI